LVIDNGSTDDSLNHIKAWAKEKFNIIYPWLKQWKNFAKQPISNSYMWREYSRSQAIKGGDVKCRNIPLILINNESNLGFSKGNNVGIKFAIAQGDMDYVWLLNNDTIISYDSLIRLVNTASSFNGRVLASSKILYKNNNYNKVWFEGGIYNPWLAKSAHVMNKKFIMSKYKFLSGCALFIPCSVLNEIGLLDESIFLYAEDLDYSIRATKLNIPLIVVKSSKVAHLGSASISTRSPKAYRNHVMNIIKVIRKYHGEYRIISIVTYHLMKLVYLILFKHIGKDAIKAYLRGILMGITKK